MKYKYIYKTGDGVRRDATIEAMSREEVFARLRRQGIRPIKVLSADGSLDNGAVNGVRRRVVVAVAVGAAALAAAAVWLVAKETPKTLGELEADYIQDTHRRQIIGDAAVIAKGIRVGWTNVFESVGERFLASYAIPGAQPAVVRCDEADLRAVLERDAAPAADEMPIECRQIAAMVVGMKAELRKYLADGGTVASYCQRLVSRQQAESSYYLRAKNELEAAQKAKVPDGELERLWEKRNGELRAMGIMLVPLPE